MAAQSQEGDKGMVGYREARFGEEPPRQGLETWISLTPSIVEWAVQPMRHGSLSSKVQADAADLFNWMWTFARGAVGIKLHVMLIEYELPAAGSCARVCNMV